MSEQRVYLITGASRGIGLEFTRQLAEGGNKVISTCRNPDKSDGLKALQEKHADLITVVPLDVSDEKSISDAAAVVKKDFDNIDVLINNAGTFFKVPGDGRENSLTTTADVLKKTFDVNTIGPVLVTQAFYPLLKNASNVNGASIVHVSSMMASMVASKGMSVVSYQTSKCAPNMVAACQASDFKKDNITVLILHPGWVDTAMGRGAGGKPPVTPPQSVTGMLKLMGEATAEDSGTFKDFNGNVMPW